MQTQSDPVNLAHFLLQAKESGLLDSNDFFNQLKTVVQNSGSKNEKASKQDFENFCEFYKKNSTCDITTLKTSEPQRLYVDGVFDMVHSGHFNAIRQVILEYFSDYQAKQLCDVLVVGVCSQEEVEHHKGYTLSHI